MQLRQRNTTNKKEICDNHDNDDNSTIESFSKKDEEENDDASGRRHNRDTFYSSMDGTLVPQSPQLNDNEKYPVPNLPIFENKIFVPSSATADNSIAKRISNISDIDLSENISCLSRNHSTKEEQLPKYLSKKSMDQSTIA
jgi:hypothetical protein